jgi:hypothetical protein
MKTHDEIVLTRSQRLGLLILVCFFIAYLVVRLRG